MRQLLLVMTVLAWVIFPALAADVPALKTNSVAVDNKGMLKIAAPRDWTFGKTNLPGAPVYAVLSSPSNTIGIDMWIYWDGFGKTNSKPTQADFEQIVSNICARTYEPNSVERKTVLETLQGPAVTGTFARFTEANWMPMVKGDYPNIANGMFRSGNLWGRFNLVTYDKDGPQFQQGLKILESIRREP
ncbi:MAG TPA: hypothetical protein VKV04_12755 [Verrucomicrobiae bacterium]|nr:hypothetical protein [Verrucomicrobiae bacterium]